MVNLFKNPNVRKIYKCKNHLCMTKCKKKKKKTHSGVDISVEILFLLG